MIVEESNQEAQWHVEDRYRLGRPDCRRHWHEVMIDEFPAVTLPGQKLTKRFRVAEMLCARQCRPVEAQYVANHSVERRSQDVAALCEQRVQGRAAILEVAIAGLHAETHCAALRRLSNFIEQLNEVRVGALVEDDEPRVDGEALTILENVDRIRVAADVVAGFEHGDVVLVAQLIGRYVTGYAGTDDRDLRSAVVVHVRLARSV